MKGIDSFLPDNLKIDFDSMCNRCPFIDVSSETEHLYGDNSVISTETKVSCKNIKPCRRAYMRGIKDD